MENETPPINSGKPVKAAIDHAAPAANNPLDKWLSALAVPAEGAAALCGISRAQWWKLHGAGKTPLPVRLGTKAPRWRVSELRAWLDGGCPDRQRWESMHAMAKHVPADQVGGAREWQ
jgi:predicted DNA-binding transcriptional regulator AlpA